jgi:hypothetical protein
MVSKGLTKFAMDLKEIVLHQTSNKLYMLSY